MIVLMVFIVLSTSCFSLVIDLNASCSKLDRFWTHTGFSPLDSSSEATESLLLSKDEKVNLALISALPKTSISHVRIHWLLNLVHKRNSTYEWSKLDEVLDWIATLKLNMIFEIMGLPLSDSKSESLEWSQLCFELTDHLVGYFDYALSCIDGIRRKIPKAVIGGPAGLFKNVSTHKLCWGFLEKCNSLRDRCNINFISFHKKAFPEDLLTESFKLAMTIRKQYPALSKLPFFNSEADLMSGWWKPLGWRGDVYYAAAIVNVVNLFMLNNSQNLFMGISNDNGFLNTRPFFFDQRTLLTRFNFSSSDSTQFFKKPVYVATALLGKLENNVLSIGSDLKSSLVVIPSINSCRNASSSTIILANLYQDNYPVANNLEIILPSYWGEVQFTFYALSNSLDHPKKIWKKHGSPQFPDPYTRELMRKSEEPHFILQGKAAKMIKLGFLYPNPSVGMIQICTKLVDKPQMILGLNTLNITHNEVLLIWSDDDSRCISTYEVEYCPHDSNNINCFRRINEANIILCSFQHVNYSEPNEENVRGTYRVRAVNVWGAAGPYSPPHHYPNKEVGGTGKSDLPI